MSNRIWESKGGANREFELTSLHDISKEELTEFMTAVLIEMENLANIAELPKVENLLRLAIGVLAAAGSSRHAAGPEICRSM